MSPIRSAVSALLLISALTVGALACHDVATAAPATAPISAKTPTPPKDPRTRAQKANPRLLKERLALLSHRLGFWNTRDYVHHAIYQPSFKIPAGNGSYLLTVDQPMRLVVDFSKLKLGTPANPCEVTWLSKFDNVPTWVYPDSKDLVKYYPTVSKLRVEGVIPLYNLVGVSNVDNIMHLYFRTRDDVPHAQLTVTATPASSSSHEASATLKQDYEELMLAVDSPQHAKELWQNFIDASAQCRYVFMPNNELKPIAVKGFGS